MGVRKLLLVDDDHLVLSVTTMLLESRGYAVVAVPTGKAALSSVKIPFDAAVLDYDLPDMNGVQLARSLKILQPHLPIILYSGCVTIPESALHEIAAIVSKADAFPQLLTALAGLTRLGRPRFAPSLCHSPGSQS